MNFPAIPYVHVYGDLSYYFDFNGIRYEETKDQHDLDRHQDVLYYAKSRAILKYYDYYLRQQKLPPVLVTHDLLDKLHYQYYNPINGKYKISGLTYEDENQCYISGVRSLLFDLNVKGVKK